MMKESNSIRSENLKVGDYISRISYCKIVSKTIGGMEIENEFGKTWGIGNGILDEEKCNSASYFEITEKMSRAKLVEVLDEVGDSIFTVTFNRQPKEGDVTKVLEGLNSGRFPTKTEIKDKVKKVYKGKERTVVGYRVGKTELGRILMIDLEKKQNISKGYETRVVSVDTRTVTCVINKGVKYILK